MYPSSGSIHMVVYNVKSRQKAGNEVSGLEVKVAGSASDYLPRCGARSLARKSQHQKTYCGLTSLAIQRRRFNCAPKIPELPRQCSYCSFRIATALLSENPQSCRGPKTRCMISSHFLISNPKCEKSSDTIAAPPTSSITTQNPENTQPHRESKKSNPT